MPHTDDDLKAGAGFVLYELWMLQSCAATKVDRTPTPGCCQTPGHLDVFQNLLCEGLVLHSRVLRDFFFTKVNSKAQRATFPDDIVAVDYFSRPTIWAHNSGALSPYLKNNKERMDKALAHLSVLRLEYQQTSDKEWDAGQLLLEINDKWFDFFTKLEKDNPERAAWFRKHEYANRVGFPR
ncbi:MAG: hypothetical protein GXY83_35365 [Rhodopirellula sp.]|nr:hypothetical protein [Rhodopirellula sp.]